MSINYDELLAIIQSELVEYINMPENYDLYKDYKIVLSLEQQFMKLKDKDPNAIYLVVKFTGASVFFGQTAVPISIVALSEENKSYIAQTLMTGFVETYNLMRNSDNTIQQVWNSPTVSSNFNAVYAGYRSIVRISGVLVITKNAAYYEIYYKYTDDDGNEQEQKVPTVSTAFSLVNTPDSQPFYNSADFVKSIVTFGIFTLTLTTFLLNDNWIISKVIDMLTYANTKLVHDASNSEWVPEIEKDNQGNVITSKSNPSTTVNETFKIGIRFVDGRERDCEMKLINCQVSERIGEIPTLTLTLSE